MRGRARAPSTPTAASAAVSARFALADSLDELVQQRQRNLLARPRSAATRRPTGIIGQRCRSIGVRNSPHRVLGFAQSARADARSQRDCWVVVAALARASSGCKRLRLEAAQRPDRRQATHVQPRARTVERDRRQAIDHRRRRAAPAAAAARAPTAATATASSGIVRDAGERRQRTRIADRLRAPAARQCAAEGTAALSTARAASRSTARGPMTVSRATAASRVTPMCGREVRDERIDLATRGGSDDHGPANLNKEGGRPPPSRLRPFTAGNRTGGGQARPRLMSRASPVYWTLTTSAARRFRRRVSSRALSYFGRSSP